MYQFLHQNDDAEDIAKAITNLSHFHQRQRNGINSLPHNPDFSRPPRKKALENIERKGVNAGNQHFLLFPQCFLV